MLSKVHKSRGEFLINSITPHSFFLGVLPPITKQRARTTGCVHGAVGWSHHLGDLEGLLGSQNPSVCWDHTGGMRGGVSQAEGAIQVLGKPHRKLYMWEV